MSRLTCFLTFGLMAGLPVLGRAADTVTPAPQTAVINKLMASGWEKAGVKRVAEKSSDLEFLRRSFLDLIGRIPTVEEALDFDQDRGPNKRPRLIHRLLYAKDYKPKVNGQVVKIGDKKDATDLSFSYTDEFAEHWANVWTVWLLTRSGHPLYREQLNMWLWKELGGNAASEVTPYDKLVTKLLTATGKSNENGAVNFVIHHLGEATPQDKRSDTGPFDGVPITSRVTRLFLGIQTNCTQCHDHPFNKEWIQADFWGVNAFFRQTVRDRTPTGLQDRQMMAEPAKVSLTDQDEFNKNSVIFYERRDGKLMATKPNFLKDLGKAEAGETDNKPVAKSTTNRRAALAEYVVKHDNFSKALVNRMWGHLFGRGMNKEPSIDDFGSHNEVVHPELLAELGKEFAGYQYDFKKLLFWLCCSDVYGLSHVAHKDTVDPKFEPYLTRMPLKAMSPEVLYDALATALRMDQTPDARKTQRDLWMSKLVRNFGDDEGNEMTFNGTVVQALLMMNGRELNGELGASLNPRAGVASNSVTKIVAKHSKNGTTAVNASAVIDELFLAALTRHPTQQEMSKILGLMTKGAVIAGDAAKPADAKPTPDSKPLPPTTGKGKNRPMPTTVPSGPRQVAASGPNDITFYQDVFWALLNTNEFILNH
jgi:hypothetical protein